MTAADRANAAERVLAGLTSANDPVRYLTAAFEAREYVARADERARWTTARDALAEEWEGGHAEALASMRALHFAERPAMAEAYGYRANAYASAAARLRGLVTTSSEEEQ